MKILMVILFSFLLFGCIETSPNQQPTLSHNAIYIEKIRDCEYVLWEGYKSGGIVHAADCKNSIHLKTVE